MKAKFNPQFRIPRYLGLQEARERNGHVELTLGYSAALRRKLETDQDGVKLIESLLQPKTMRQVEKETGLKTKNVRQALDQLEQSGVVKAVQRVPPEYRRYDRHLLFYDLQGTDALAAQKRISKARIALIGMGGIGSWVSLGLIGAGFKELKLMDFDVVELSNLTRQILYTEADVGRSKTKTAAKVLRARNGNTKVTPVEMKVKNAKELRRHLRGMDFVIVSADRPAQIHDWVDEVCLQFDIPYINLGYRDGLGVVGPMTAKGKTSCYQCHKPARAASKSAGRRDGLREAFEDRYQAPSFGPLNALVSSTGVMEVIKYITGLGHCRSLGVELEIDPMTLNVRETLYARDASCWHCGGAHE